VVPIAELLSKKKSLKTDSVSENAPVQKVKQRETNQKPTETSNFDKPKKTKLSPREVFDQACESFSHLRPFLASADFDISGSTLSIGFHQQIPRLIREEIEGEFRDRLARDLARSMGHAVDVSFSYFVEKTESSGQEKLKDHPLVKQVLETFGGEVEAITNKENI